MNDIVSFDCSLDGKIIVYGDAYGKIYKHTGELLCNLSKKEHAFLCPVSICNISPNGKEILVGDITGMTGIDGSTMPLLEDDDNNITVCVFSPNEKNGVTIQIHFLFFGYSRNGLSDAILPSIGKKILQNC